MSFTNPRRLLLALVASIVLICPASAITINSLLGDKDGFGLAGAPAVPADGTRWATDLGGVFFTDYRDAGDLANAPFTDIWDSPGGFSYTHTYALGAVVPTAAVLQIQIAGIHDINTATVYNVVVDATVIGVIPPNLGASAFEEILLYSFPVPLVLISGSESVSVSLTGGDGYAINFSELIIEGVPEPSTVIMAGMGLAGLVVCGWRRRRAAG